MEIEVVDYLKAAPKPAEIERALRLHGLEPRQLMRSGEDEYRSARADDPKRTRTELVALMHAHPILIERPVVFAGDRARIGRTPEAVLEIL